MTSIGPCPDLRGVARLAVFPVGGLRHLRWHIHSLPPAFATPQDHLSMRTPARATEASFGGPFDCGVPARRAFERFAIAIGQYQLEGLGRSVLLDTSTSHALPPFKS